VQIGKGSVGAGLAIAQKVPPPQASAVAAAVKNSFMAGMHAGSFTVAAVTFAGAIAAWLFLPGRDLVPAAQLRAELEPGPRDDAALAIFPDVASGETP
jgi:hypothetical protein